MDKLVESSSTEIAKVQSLCNSLNNTIMNLDMDDPFKDLLKDMCSAIAGLGNAQESILAIVKKRKPAVRPNPPHPAAQSNPSFVNLGSVPKRHKVGNYDQRFTSVPSQDQGQAPPFALDPMLHTGHQDPPRESDGDPAKRKFREAVKDSEKAILIFNLDMGRFPTLNENKMATQATLALTKKAAKKEGSQGDIPSEDAIAAIDDITSVTKTVKFFGKQTKPCKKNKEGGNAEYYTIPVRYDFGDKETKSRVETILRKTCDIQCATPYPPILRDCIKQTISAIKQDYPRDFIRVNVDTANFALKPSRRPPGEGEEWIKLGAVPLPVEALDVSSRKIPDNLIISLPIDIYSPGRKSRKDSHEGKNREKSKSPEKGEK